MSNQDYLTSLTAEINNIKACDRLQEVAQRAISYVEAEIASAEQDILDLALQLIVPVDLVTTIIWITVQIKAKYKAYLAYIQRLERIVEEGKALVSAIESAVNNIENCSIGVSIDIPVPNIVIPTIEALNGGKNPFG